MHYSQKGLTGDELEKQLFWDAVTFDLMKKWRAVHFPITLVFVVLFPRVKRQECLA